MILTEEFINKQGSDNARAFFGLATSLGYTILCPEDETGSLKRGFMLQNQNGALYSCPAGETALDVMTPILRFVIDFERAGTSTSAQPSCIDQLEERISKLEKLLNAPYPVETQKPSTDEVKLKELMGRAKNIGNTLLQTSKGALEYSRPRRSDPIGRRWQVVFTSNDILKSQQDRSHRQHKWLFSQSELDELEKAIAHDEKLYAEHFGKPD